MNSTTCTTKNEKKSHKDIEDTVNSLHSPFEYKNMLNQGLGEKVEFPHEIHEEGHTMCLLTFGSISEHKEIKED
jgi:hypothetical protein